MGAEPCSASYMPGPVWHPTHSWPFSESHFCHTKKMPMQHHIPEGLLVVAFTSSPVIHWCDKISISDIRQSGSLSKMPRSNSFRSSDTPRGSAGNSKSWFWI
eukprot:TRINITY_DN28048_c0_g1_i1.p1 TRINITY_DN28048_c0_g1~~TRINITY_DN28048_c0_g1_i1.p1  ORF type:complete len:102 (+),score=3.97 TRINITY_DN28048_c0_g1_i1:60-365(+)